MQFHIYCIFYSESEVGVPLSIFSDLDLFLPSLIFEFAIFSLVVFEMRLFGSRKSFMDVFQVTKCVSE